MQNKHEDHHKRCLKLQWGKNTGQITVDGIIAQSWSADVDLWFCDDCQTHCMHDWPGNTYPDIKLKNGEDHGTNKE